MDFVKKNWLYLTLGVVALGSIATAAWAYMAGDEIATQVADIQKLQSDVQREGTSNPQNAQTIEAKKAEQIELIAEQEKTFKAALGAQLFNAFENRARQTLVPDVLPMPKSNGVRIEFRNAYGLALQELPRRLHARGPATVAELTRQQAIDEAKNQQTDSNVDLGPWMPKPTEDEGTDAPKTSQKERTLLEILREYPKAKASEIVARTCYMYIDDDAFDPQDMLGSTSTPTVVEIWHAQMTLWIQQDFAFAIARLNDKRAEELKAQNKAYDCWVAHMPVKRLKYLAGENWLVRGGAMNKAAFAPSFTGNVNDSQKFILPLQIRVVIEEAALLELVDSVCRVGYYTPTRITYRNVEPNVLQDEYIYGDAPIIDATIDFEGVFFRKAFDPFVPKEIEKGLARPEGLEEIEK
jgi:hypothetical protein